MRKLIRNQIHRIAEYVELIIAVVIVCVIILCVYSMIVRVSTHPFEIQDEERFYEFLESAMSLIVGIEFLKMIIIPTSQNVIETLLFAVARLVIIDHSTLVLITGIGSVLVLFIIKKYLVSDFIEDEVSLFSGNTLITRVNKIMNTDLPISPGKTTLAELMVSLLKEKGEIIQPYCQVKINGVILTATRVKNNSLRKIEVFIEHKEEEKI